MTNKTGIKAGSNEPQTPEDQLALKLALREAEKRAADEKRRADDLEARMKNAPKDKAPPAAKTPGTHTKLNLNSNFRVMSAIRWAIFGGAIGLGVYTAKEFMSPAKNLFMAGPKFLSNSLGGGLKGTVSALALASAQLLGVGVGGMEAYDYAKEKTAFENSNMTMTARGGIAGFVTNQFIRSSADSKDHTSTQPFFETLKNNTINSAADLTTKARDELASLDEPSVAPANRADGTKAPISLRNKFVQVCTPMITDSNGRHLPDAARAIADKTMERHFTAVSNVMNAMKNDPGSELNKILAEPDKHAQLIVTAYNVKPMKVTVNAVENRGALRCPENHLSATYEADKWMAGLGIRPRGLDLVKP